MSNELALLEVSENNYPKIYCAGGLSAFYEKAKSEVDGEVPDLSTGKGRDRIASLAAGVSRSKVAVEAPGRAYNKFLKAQPKLIDKELREFCDKMDKLRGDTRAPLTAWEIIDKAEKAQVIDTEAFLIEYELKHEDGHRDNELFDLKIKQAEADRKAEIERATIKAAAEAKAKAEQEAAAKITKANQDKIDAEQREQAANQAAKVAAAQAESNRIAQEERAKIDAAEADRRHEIARWGEYISEAYSYNDQLIAAENARLAEVNRQEAIAENQRQQQAMREADLDNKAAKNNAAKDAIIALGFNEEGAKAIVKAIAKGLIPAVTIIY